MKQSQIKPRVVFITTGYPTEYRPQECIFIHRSIKVISEVIQPVVIHFRALKPGRKVIENRIWEGIDVITISCPQLPFGSYSHFNSQLMEIFGEPLVRMVLRSADLIHGAQAYPAGYVSGKWAIKYRKPFSFNVIGSDLNLFLTRNYKQIGRRWLNNLQGVVCNSNTIKADLQNLIGVLPNTITIYRGVDSKQFSPEGIAAGPQTILPPVRFLYLGGFHTWDPQKTVYNLKGGHTLLEAWESIDEQQLSASLAIGGPGNYDEELEKWQGSLKRSQLVFNINSINPSEVANYIRACDVVIIPSLKEGLPNLANEAQACSRPVLGTNAGGIPESVSDGKTGIIIPLGDANALAAGIKWFCDNQDQITEMGENGLERVSNYFTWEQYKKSMFEFIKSSI